MRLYFARHGQSEANVLQRISNRGWRFGLTETGQAQAYRLAEQLRDTGIARVFTSPLMRAVQTAEIVSDTLGLPLERTDALREFDCGEAEERSDPQAWALHAWVCQAWQEGRPGARIQGGDSREDLWERLHPFVEGLLRQGQDALLVGHKGMFMFTLPELLVNVNLAFALQHGLPNTAYVLAEQRPHGLVCLEWCRELVPEVRGFQGSSRPTAPP